MAKTNIPIFLSDGDLEVAILHENKEAFASIVNRDLYYVSGKAPDQNVMFQNAASLDLFCIRVFEFLNEKFVQIPSGEIKLSILSGASWIARKYASKTDMSKLVESIANLTSWLDTSRDIEIWTGNNHLKIPLTRRTMLKYASLMSKHSLLSISGVIRDLEKLAQTQNVPKSKVIESLSVFAEEIKTRRICYLASQLIELLFDYFVELNEVIVSLHGKPKVHMSEMNFPEGTTDEYTYLHWTTLTFATGYSREHYGSLRPHTPNYMKQRF